MTYQLNETHDPARRSWVESANQPGTDFPVQNLPFGVFRTAGDERARVGVAIGDRILDLAACGRAGLWGEGHARREAACASASLNLMMALGAERWSALRQRLSQLLSDERHRRAVEPLLMPAGEVEMLLPAAIGDYTDFYASVHHATNVGSMFRPDNPLLPNYKYLPVGYHGRASSIVASGAAVRRPRGQTQQGEAPPAYGPSRQLDYELEVGLFIGPGNEQGEPILIAEAPEQIFGLCLVNDWSARDIQRWEYQPLGPFLAKSFATTISPWVVTLEALAPFRAPAFRRPEGDPAPLPHLFSPEDQERGGLDLTLEVRLSTARMRAEKIEPAPLSRGNFREMYWTPAQMVTHHASNGCNLRPGDLLASGTVSGPTKESRGCLLELTWRGEEPVRLPTGETRRFLEDGDEVIFGGRCAREGFVGIGLGECRGTVHE